MSYELLNPRGIFHFSDRSIAPRLTDLNGRILGLIDNSKANADLFLDEVLKRLKDIFQLADIRYVKKPAGSVPASYPQDFLEQCDAVINAFGD